MRDTRLDPLPSELRRRRERAAAELANGVEWHDGCPASVGVEVMVALDTFTNVARRVLDMADKRINEHDARVWVTAARLQGEGDDEERLDALAAVVGAFVWLAANDDEVVDSGESHRADYAPEYDVQAFVEVVNDRLLHARVDWSFEDGRFQERGNHVMHSEVLRPATILLADNPALALASAAFQSALTKLSKGETDVALTEAATALQEFFRALGADGNSLSDQLDSAANQKLISSADRNLMKPLMGWVNADRSNRGNAHHHRAGDVSKADAWLMMHVVGALMVRLSNREPRDIVAAREMREAEAEAARQELERLKEEAAQLEAAAREPDPWKQSAKYGDDTPF